MCVGGGNEDHHVYTHYFLKWKSLPNIKSIKKQKKRGTWNNLINGLRAGS